MEYVPNADQDSVESIPNDNSKAISINVTPKSIQKKSNRQQTITELLKLLVNEH